MRQTQLRFTMAVVSAISLLAACISALGQTKTPVYVNVATAYAYTWAVGQGVALSTTVVGNPQNPPAPSGTVEFFANGQSVATVTLIDYGQNVGGNIIYVPFQTPGTYTLTATYSGDAAHAAGSSTYTSTFLVMVNPPTILPTSTPSQLTFPAGATSGNVLNIEMQSINGFNGGANWTTVITPVPGTVIAAIQPSIVTNLEAGDSNGIAAFNVVIGSYAPKTVTVIASKSHSSAAHTKLMTILAVCLLFPFSFQRRRPAPLLVLFLGLAGFSCLIGCGAQPQSPRTTTETISGSAGSYYVTISGQAYDRSGSLTYFSVKIPVTVE